MTSHCLQLKSGKSWINDISENIEAVFLKMWNKMTLLVLSPWQQFWHWWCVNKNKNYQFCLETETIYPTQSNDGSEDNMGTMSVSSRNLCHFRGRKWGYLVFRQKETGAEIVAMATALRVSFCFFCDAQLWCQVLRTLFQYFQRYRLFSIFHFLVANNMTSSLI